MTVTWQESTEYQAEYYGIERVKDSGSIEEDHYRNGMLLGSDSYRVDSLGNHVTVARVFDDQCHVAYKSRGHHL